MISTIKSFAPLVLYLIGVVLCLLAFSGRVRYALLFVIALLPLRNVIERLHPFPLGKDFIDVLFIAMIIGWFLGTVGQGIRFAESSLLNPISILLMIYTFFTLMHGYFYLNYFDFFNLHDPRVQDWKNYCILPLLYFLTLNNIREKKWVWWTVIVMCVTMFIMNFYLLKQISWFSGIVSRDKIDGTFVYLGPNEVAAFYNQYTVFLLSLYFAMKNGIPKWLLLILIAMNVYCVIFLFSRAAYLGLVVGLFFLFALKKRILLIPLILLVLFWQVALPQEVRTRIEMTVSEYGELDPSVQNRIDVWRQSMDLFNKAPIFGIGFGVFRFMGFSLKDTHNIYLKIMAEQGIIGLIVFLVLIFIFLAQGWRLYRNGDDEASRAFGLGFSLLIIVLVVNNLFGDRWTYMEVSSYLWILAGLVSRLNIFSKKL